MAHQTDVIPDDMSIARGLLGRPDIPLRRRTSFTSTTRSAPIRDVSNEPEESTSIKDDRRRQRMMQSSNTWTTSSGEILSDKDDVEDRTFFILEYNRLATKHGVRTLIQEDSDSSNVAPGNSSNKSGSWFSRKILRRTSSTQSVKHKSDRHTKHRRSISDLSLCLKSKNDALKDKDLQELVRLCGLSLLYLPTEYAAGSLAVPTCFRATAQYLVQHASTSRGVFRIPGSHNIVAALYNHYCTMDEHGSVVAGTVRCPTLPEHIRCDVHDVASAFKKFIAGLPGGILGSLPLFDAFISIQSQLNSTPELTRTKQSKVRPRLIALAIATLKSQYRRELICAVFGLLSMIGRTAEIAPRENEHGRPLPTSDLMGYYSLGIVFGPLLVGDLLENYTMCLANPRGGLVVLPISPPKSRKERSKKNKTSEDCSAFNTHVDKIKIANSITEMLITHWRDVVRHMKNMRALRMVRSYKSLEAAAPKQPFLRPSASESFALRKPPDWDNDNIPLRRIERCESPTPASRGGGLLEARPTGGSSPKSNDTLTIRKQRSRPRPMSNQMLSGARSMSILSPTREENPTECSPKSAGSSAQQHPSPTPCQPHKKLLPHSKVPAAANTRTSEEQERISPRLLMENSSRYNLYKKGYPFSDDLGVIKGGSYDGQEHTPAKPTMRAESLLVQKHALKDSPSQIEHNDCALPTKSHYSLKQTRLIGPHEPETSALCQLYPDNTPSGLRYLGQTKPTAGTLRRTSASEPGSRLPMPIKCSIRHAKTTFVETELGNADNWHTPKDPLTRVSVAEDLASLVTLAQILEEEPVDVEPNSNSSGNPAGERLDELSRQDIECRLPKLIEELDVADAGGTLSKDESNFAKLSKDVADEYARRTLLKAKYEAMGEMAHREVSLKANKSRPIAKSLEKSTAIQGASSCHIYGRTPSPKKKSPERYLVRLGSQAINNQQSPVVLPAIALSMERQVENSQAPVNESPRVSVRALAAKFNNEDSRSMSSSSPTKSLSKAMSLDIRACSSSPNEKIVAPYTTNPPSPTKSFKSGISEVSLRSVRMLPPIDLAVAKTSPPRRLLRSDLDNLTPLRSVPKRESGSQALDTPAFCSPARSPQRLSLYDGPSVQYSRQMSSEERTACPIPPHVHFESKRSSAAIEKPVTTSNTIEAQPILMAINLLTSPPPTRSNSLLHTQIRNLQQELNTKIEEIRHLKRQLGSRGSLDMGALSEELRETKKEFQVWKNRAEVAEKQLQVMRTLSARDFSSHKTTNSSLVAVIRSTSTPSRTGYSEDGVAADFRVKRALHVFDGASSLTSSSECSTNTVLRDCGREESATESEYGMWVGETVERY